MTLCIAAPAHDAGEPRIILCFDSLIGDELGTAEAALKCDPEFARGLAAMFAGTVEDAEDAIRMYKERFKVTPATLAHIKEQLWIGIKELKDSLARQGRKRTDVQLIVAGFIENKPKILYVDHSRIVARPDFLAIGTGAGSAEAMLRWRQSTRHRPLHEVMYYAYEAKRFGETSPYVGQMTTMLVLEPKDGDCFRVRTVVTEGLRFLFAQFERFGPQPFVTPERFPENGLI